MYMAAICQLPQVTMAMVVMYFLLCEYYLKELKLYWTFSFTTWFVLLHFLSKHISMPASLKKKPFIAILLMLSTRILIIIFLRVDFSSFPLWDCFQWHVASFCLPTEMGTWTLAKWKSDKLARTNCFSLLIKDCTAVALEGPECGCGRCYLLSVFTLWCGHVIGQARGGKGVPGELRRPPKNQELESPEAKLRGESPEKECDFRVTRSWPRA